MKTLKTFAIITLAVTFAFGPVSLAFAGPNYKMKGWNKPKTAGNWGVVNKNAKLGPINKIPQQQNQGQGHKHGHRHGHDHGFDWGTFAGATVMGLAVSSMANQQQQQQTQPTVVYVEKQTDDTTKQQYLELEIERERAKRLALEAELERIKAENN